VEEYITHLLDFLTSRMITKCEGLASEEHPGSVATRKLT
jgi:hypothetical protein